MDAVSGHGGKGGADYPRMDARPSSRSKSPELANESTLDWLT